MSYFCAFERGENMKKKFWEMKQSANKNEADIYIYGEIVAYKWDDGDTTAASFHNDLKALGDVEIINLHVNSPGGSVFEGIAIGNMLKAHKATVNAYVDALAASIASVITASCDVVYMYSNSMQMIHHPWMGCRGNAKDFRKTADDLDAIAQASIITYLNKSNGKLNEEQIVEVMDNESWISAIQAQEYGLCDIILGENQIAAALSTDLFEKYQNVPEQFRQVIQNNQQVITEERVQMAEQAKQSKQYINEILGGI
ncbi:ATP-dependent Clp protease proteolytic subunit [Listeria newyorkensis]|nr:ATP-dependent Clp protease proteolytic subunit [Listeria newyorkensis]